MLRSACGRHVLSAANSSAGRRSPSGPKAEQCLEGGHRLPRVSVLATAASRRQLLSSLPSEHSQRTRSRSSDSGASDAVPVGRREPLVSRLPLRDVEKRPLRARAAEAAGGWGTPHAPAPSVGPPGGTSAKDESGPPSLTFRSEAVLHERVTPLRGRRDPSPPRRLHVSQLELRPRVQTRARRRQPRRTGRVAATWSRATRGSTKRPRSGPSGVGPEYAISARPPRAMTSRLTGVSAHPNRHRCRQARRGGVVLPRRRRGSKTRPVCGGHQRASTPFHHISWRAQATG